MDNFVQLQLKLCGHKNLVTHFEGITRDKFLELGYGQLRELVPDDEMAQAKLFLWIKGLADVHIVNEVIHQEFNLINDVHIKEESSIVKTEPEVGTDSDPNQNSGIGDIETSYSLNYNHNNIKTEPEPDSNSNVSPSPERPMPILTPQQPQPQPPLQIQPQPDNNKSLTLTLSTSTSSANSSKVLEPKEKTSSGYSFSSNSDSSSSSDSDSSSSCGSKRKRKRRDDAVVSKLNGAKKSNKCGLVTNNGDGVESEPGPSRNMTPIMLKSPKIVLTNCVKKQIARSELRETGTKIIQSAFPKKRVPKILKNLNFLQNYKGRIRNLTSLTFEFNDLDVMNQVLLGIKSEHKHKLRNLTKLTFKSDKHFLIGELQLIILKALPQFRDLTTLGLDVGFPENLLPVIERLLGESVNLQYFSVEHGFVGKSEGPLTLKIPQMNKLVSFSWGTNHGVHPILQKQSTIIDIDLELDLEDDSEDSASVRIQAIIPVIMDFSAINLFPTLQTIELGVTAGIKMKDMDQFPVMTSFGISSFWDPLLIFPPNPLGVPKNFIQSIQFPNQMSDPKHVERVIQECRHLTEIWMWLPSIQCLRTLIRLLKNSLVTHLYLQTNYDFESALISALLDLPYVLRTWNDRVKLRQLKTYKHWRKFVKYFKIDVPEEEEEDSDIQILEPETQTVSSPPPRRSGIGSISTLRAIHFEHEPKTIFMPFGDKMWTDPNFIISKNSSFTLEEYPFPKEIIVDELTKLKKLDKFIYYGLKVCPQDWKVFEERMSFVPVQVDWPMYSDLVDPNSLTHHISVKDEK